MNERSKICRTETEDRISNLPDEVLHLILSYLKTKHAVQTCVLSKRWRNLWTGISTLHFEDSSFPDDSSFKKFLNHVILHRDVSQTIRQFKISYGNMDDVSIMKLVMKFVDMQGCDIQDLVLGSNITEREFLPQPYWNLLHRWDSLKTLSLQHISIPVNVDYAFFSLITLHLTNCQLWNDDDGNDDDDDDDDDDEDHDEDDLYTNVVYGSLKITAPQLKEFKMSFMHYEQMNSNFKMILSFPKLTSFCFEGEKMVPLSFSHKPVLQNLNVDYDEYGYADEFVYKHLIDMLGAVGGAKFVTLSERTIRAMSKFPDIMKGKQCPFSRMEELKIIIRSSEIVDNNFSFTVPSSVTTYLLSNSPSKDIKFVYKSYEENDKKPYFPSSVVQN
ncbi:F-box/LRR-repeat protein 25-like [Senna tora]|uniref:F-box/LRR-repeat protein 25-like n=1 Tax=Senna tora TaxID=362788 RepID=A0A834XC89_9FABA|nr:F-box/LRR-repeat protein 25-like [Senna tora]